MLFDAVFNATDSVSLHGPGAELEGGGVHTPPAGRVRRRAPARRAALVNIAKITFKRILMSAQAWPLPDQ